MAITTNAKDAARRASVKAFINSVDPDVRRRKIRFEFSDGKVSIHDGSDTTTMSPEVFEAWEAEGFPLSDRGPDLPKPKSKKADDDIRPQPKPQRKGKAQKGGRKLTKQTSAEANAAKAEAASRSTKATPKRKGTPRKPPTAAAPKPETKPLESESVLDQFAAEAFEIAHGEHQGETGRNIARFKRGELMIRLRDATKASRIPVKKALKGLNERMMVLANQRNLPDFSLISEAEASATRKVVEAFGSDTEFKLLDKLNPITGEPLVRDDGEPYRMPITEVAMNKLAPLVEFVNEEDFDRLASFAFNHSEKVVKGAKRVASRTGAPMKRVIGTLTRLTEEATSPLAPELGTITVNAGEEALVREISKMLGEAPAPEIATIKTDKNWYEAFWVPLKSLMSQLMRLYKPEVVSQSNGEVSNVFVFERTIGQFFSVNEEDGINRILGALVQAEDLTEAQANTFLNRFQLNTDTGEWIDHGEQEEVVAAADDVEELDEEDFDIETGDDDDEFEDDEPDDGEEEEFDDED